MLAIVYFSTNNNIGTSIKLYSVMSACRIFEENFMFFRLLATCGNFRKKIGTLALVALELTCISNKSANKYLLKIKYDPKF